MLLLVASPRASLGSMLRQTSSRYQFSVQNADKPFLDGDFLRDSSNPLDVYEDLMNTPPPSADAGNTTSQSASANTSAVQVALAGASLDVSTKGKTSHSLRAASASAAPNATESGATSAKETNTSSAATTKSTATNTSSKADNSTVSDTATEAKASTNKSTAESVENLQTCVTRKDERVWSLFTGIAPEGTPCVFGADDRDEGFHCVYSDGAYGENGWCFTTKDASVWGSCNSHCPLYGAPAALGSKIDGIAKVMSKISDKVDKLDAKANATAKPTSSKDSTEGLIASTATNSEATESKASEAKAAGAEDVELASKTKPGPKAGPKAAKKGTSLVHSKTVYFADMQ